MGGNLSKEEEELIEGVFDVPPDSHEYKFCDKILGILSTPDLNLQEEFRKRFAESPNGEIKWDFWTGEESYESAFKKCVKEIKKISRLDAKDLYLLGSKVTQYRGAELDRRMGQPSYDNHFLVYSSWMKVVEKCLSRLQRPDMDFWFVASVLLATGIFAAVGLYQFIQEHEGTTFYRNTDRY